MAFTACAPRNVRTASLTTRVIRSWDGAGATWKIEPGLANDIGVGADGSVFVIGTNAVAGGFGVSRWNGSGWDPLPGGAVRIAVDPHGHPWIANALNQIFFFTAGNWQLEPDYAHICLV